MEAELKKKAALKTRLFHANHKDDKNYQDRRKKSNRKWYLKNKEKLSRRAWSKTSNERRLVIWAQRRARKKGIPFSLKTKDVFIPESCPVLGIPLFTIGKRQTDNSPSLDRINPDLGYIPGNVQVLSNKANMMKSNATPEELIKFSKWVQENYATTIPTTGN